MSDFVISYQHGSKVFARRLRDTIQKEGIVAWMDPEIDAGERWKEVIDNAIRGSVGVIVVVTPLSLMSQYVIYEWSFALGLGKEVIPVRLEDTGNEKVHPKLGDIQYLDFVNPKKRDWPRLVSILKKIRDESGFPSPVLSARRALKTSHRKEDWAEAITFLESFPDRSTLAALSEETDNPVPYIRFQAAHMLAKKSEYQDKRSLSALCEALGNQEYRSIAARDLGRLGGNEAVQCLIAAFDTITNDPALAREFAQALAQTKHLDAALKLATLLFGGDAEVQEVAIRGLSAIANPATFPALVEVMMTHPARRMRLVAIEAIGKIDHSDVVPALIEFVKTFQIYMKREEIEMYASAVAVLGRVGNEVALQFLNEIRINGIYVNLQRQIIAAANDLTHSLRYGNPSA